MKRLYFIILFCLPALTFAQQKSRPSISGSEVTGTFRSGDNYMAISALGGNRLRVQFNGTYEYKSAAGPMANTGEARGVAMIQGDSAVFKPDGMATCIMILRFVRPNQLAVSESNAHPCTFGLNVTAMGSYRKVNQKPKFDSK